MSDENDPSAVTETRIEAVRNGAPVAARTALRGVYRELTGAVSALGSERRADAAQVELDALLGKAPESQASRAAKLLREGRPNALMEAAEKTPHGAIAVALVCAVADEPTGESRLIEMVDGSVLLAKGWAMEVLRDAQI